MRQAVKIAYDGLVIQLSALDSLFNWYAADKRERRGRYVDALACYLALLRKSRPDSPSGSLRELSGLPPRRWEEALALLIDLGLIEATENGNLTLYKVLGMERILTFEAKSHPSTTSKKRFPKEWYEQCIYYFSSTFDIVLPQRLIQATRRSLKSMFSAGYTTDQIKGCISEVKRLRDQMSKQYPVHMSTIEKLIPWYVKGDLEKVMSGERKVEGFVPHSRDWGNLFQGKGNNDSGV